MRSDAASLPSLKYFRPQYHSLNTPHPIWLSAGSNPHEIEKSICQMRMMSGRFKCEKLRRHWSQNRAGFCELQPCFSQGLVGSLEHMLGGECLGLDETRNKLLTLWQISTIDFPRVSSLVQKYLFICPEESIKLLLDPSVIPEVIQWKQDKHYEDYHKIFYMTRIYCATMHKTKMKMLGLA